MGPVGNFIGALFFALVLFAALTSSVSILEAIVSSFMDQFKMSRVSAVMTEGVIALLFGLLVCFGYNKLYFEIEEDDDLRRHGKSKQNQPLPIVGMGLFMDYDGIPLAFDIFPGNKNEQPTLKPLEKKVIHEYGQDQVIVCTDAGLSSKFPTWAASLVLSTSSRRTVCSSLPVRL